MASESCIAAGTSGHSCHSRHSSRKLSWRYSWGAMQNTCSERCSFEPVLFCFGTTFQFYSFFHHVLVFWAYPWISVFGFLIYYFYIMYECVSLRGYMLVSSGACSGQKRASDPQELELQVLWVLGFEFRSSAKAAHILNFSLICPVLCCVFLLSSF